MSAQAAGGPPGVPEDGAEVARLTELMADAFLDDPVQAWMFPDESSRARRQRRMFRSELRHLGFHHGRVLTGPGAVAIWYPPGGWQAPLGAELRQAIPMARAFGRRFPAAMRLVREVEDVHPSEPHWYLDWVAVHPSERGRRRSSVVIRPMLEHCDAHSIPAYLVSSKPENVPIYETFGFRTTSEIRPECGAPPLWAMWREPLAAPT